jgi:DNA-binding transcriptional regulator YdaS (Cro superfamily)
MIKGNPFKLEDKWFRVEREISADKSRGDERAIGGNVNAKKLRK